MVHGNQINVDMLKLHVNSIPMLDGYENNLTKFVNSCD